MTTPQVNVPSNDKQKEADINTKTQLFGIYQAFALGKAPSNKQIDVAMNSALASKGLSNPSSQLSAEGRGLIADLRDVIEKSKLLFLTKNEGNLLQDFAWQCQGIGTGNASTPGAPVDKETAKQHGNEALEGLRTLGQLLITNGQFRKLLQDAQILARDIIGDGASKAANRVNPSEDELNQIDNAAEDNTWHESPDFKGMKDQYTQKFQQNKPFGKEGAKQELQDTANTNSNRDAAANAKDKVAANMSEDQKNKVREQRDRAKNYMEEKMPKERRDQTIWRLKKMIVEIQGHEDYQRAIDTLLRLAEQYQGHTKNIGQQSAGTVKGAHSGNEGLNAAEADLRIVLERFANSTSMDDVLDSINAIYRDADADPELKGWFKHINTYIRKCLKEQGFVMKDDANEEWNQLYDQGNFLMRERYRNHTNRVVDEIKFFSEQFDKDPYNRAFADSMNKLFNDLGTDRDGKPEFKPHLLKDLGNVIIPDIINSIRYIPIPDIEFTSTDADVVIRDLVVEADNILPNIVDITSDNHFRYGRKGVKSANKNKFQVHVSGIQTHLTNIRFYAKSKKGLKMRNWGLMDVVLANTGLDFKIKLETADKTDGAHFFKVTDVDVKIANLKIQFKEQHHPILTKVAALFAKGPLIQGPIKKVLEMQIKKAVQDADSFAYQIHQDVQRAKADLRRSNQPPQNVFKQYFDAYQARMTRQRDQAAKKKEEAKQKAAEKQVQTNIAFMKDQRISKNWNGGKGIPIDEQEKNASSGAGKFTLKTAEYNKLAHDGQKWESPVFSIGSARESTNLPRVQQVTRKPHDATPSQLRGPQNASSTERSSATAGGVGAAGAGAYGANQYGSSGADQSGYGVGQGTPANLGSGVSNQYNDNSAFSSTTYGSQPNGLINDKSGTAGTGNLGPSGLGDSSAHTTLGTTNPVLTGRV